MKSSRAFTLLEVLIAISIASALVFMLGKALRHVHIMRSKSQMLVAISRRVYTLFDQMEKDLTAAFKPQEEKNNKKEKEKAETDRKEVPPFFGAVQEATGSGIPPKMQSKMCKNLHFVTTNVLAPHQQLLPKLMRVGYFLEVDKERSEGEKISYRLVRKETSDLDNITFIEPKKSERKKKKRAEVRIFVLAEYIKALYVEYMMPLPQKDERATEKKELRTYEWGEGEKTKKHIPQNITVTLVCWNALLTQETSFETTIPVFSFSEDTDEKEQKKTEQSETKKKERS